MLIILQIFVWVLVLLFLTLLLIIQPTHASVPALSPLIFLTTAPMLVL